MLKRSFFIALAAAGLALGLTAAPASAQTTNVLEGNYNLCDGSQCMNLQNGVTSPSSNIQFWHSGGNGEPNNDWNIWGVGIVDCTSNSFPFFTTDSALLSLCRNNYVNDNVYKFAWAPNGKGSGQCVTLGFRGSGQTNVILDNCAAAFSNTSPQYFIYNPTTRHLVNVSLTSSSDIFWLNGCTSSTADGAEVCVQDANPLPWTIQNKP